MRVPDFVRSLTLAGLAAFAAVGLGVEGAAAQFRVVPQIGMYAPATELPSVGDADDFGRREASLAYGAAIEFGPGFRVSVLHGSDGEIPLDAEFGCTECARSTVTSATATLVIRPLPELGFLQPYLVLGGGVKRYDFTRDDLVDENVRAVLSDANDVTGHLGLGVEFDLGPAGILVELQDLVSNFEAEGSESSFQHDLFFTVGVALGR